MKRITFFLLAAVLFTSCLESSNKTTSGTESKPTSDLIEEKQVVATGDTINIVLQSNDNMKFDKTEIEVKEGQVVRLTLKHTGTMPKTVMGHNFVLINNEMELNDFGNSVANAKAPDYQIPYSLEKYVIAKTKMIGGGESDTIEFLTPQKGSYHFLCSFPGHYGMMKGLFIVK